MSLAIVSVTNIKMQMPARLYNKSIAVLWDGTSMKYKASPSEWFHLLFLEFYQSLAVKMAYRDE